jgi:hypothetical protein
MVRGPKGNSGFRNLTGCLACRFNKCCQIANRHFAYSNDADHLA